MSGLTQVLRRTRDPELLLVQITELLGLLREHFAREEAPGGFFATVSESAPRHANRVQALAEEHASLLADLQALAGRVRAFLDGPLAELCTAAAVLSRRLRRHEIAEHHLLMQAFLTDLGTGD